MVISQLNKDDRICLGHYPQGANGEILPIEWNVVKKLPDRVLVLADKILDWQPFHNENCAIRWEHSSLREWLINSFFASAFTPDDQKVIFHPECSDDPAGDFLWAIFKMESTTDSFSDPIFLLGAADIIELFPNENALFCPGAATQMTAWVSSQHPDADKFKGNASWWLRSSKNDLSMAKIISPVASVGMSVINPDYQQGVRPAMWLKQDNSQSLIDN